MGRGIKVGRGLTGGMVWGEGGDQESLNRFFEQEDCVRTVGGDRWDNLCMHLGGVGAWEEVNVPTAGSSSRHRGSWPRPTRGRPA